MSDQEEEKGYEVKDKRRVNPDGTMREAEEESAAEPEAQQAEESEQAEQPAEPEQPQEPRQEEAPQPPPDIYSFLGLMMGLLSEQAWQLMGIRLAPGQKEMTKDMTQAKIAIDTIVFISERLSAHVEEEDRRALRALVSDLQMNFVTRN